MLQLTAAVLWFGGAFLLFAESGNELVASSALLVACFVVVAALQLTAGIALLRQHRFGWTLTMLLAGVSLTGQIATWWSDGSLVPVSMLVSVATVLYLNQTQVRAAFGLASGHRSDDPSEGRG